MGALGAGRGVRVVAHLSSGVRGRGWSGGRLFEAEHLLTFSAFRMGAYSGWVLIRGWALIRVRGYEYMKIIYVNCGVNKLLIFEGRSSQLYKQLMQLRKENP